MNRLLQLLIFVVVLVWAGPSLVWAGPSLIRAVGCAQKSPTFTAWAGCVERQRLTAAGLCR